jgi:ribosomal protein S12 methylthiotransferase accessory factor YcaO
MNLNVKRSSLADVRLRIFTEMEADVEAQFLGLMELRERLREAELSADLQNATWARSPAPVVIAASA